jgi:geranylgeranyl pyrophosphate synthase
VGTGDMRVIGLFAATLGMMVQGQIEEASRGSRPHLTLTRDGYYQTIWGKTASLFVLACEGGAILAHLPEPQVQAMREYGRCVGLAFQVVDDVLDYVGDEAQLGKPVGGDLRQGTITLPLLYLRESLSSDGFANLYERESVEQILTRVRDSSAIEQSYADANEYAQRARNALASLPSSPYRDALEEVTYQTVRRTS